MTNDDLLKEIDRGLAVCVDDTFSAIIDLGERFMREKPQVTIEEFLIGIRALRQAMRK